MMKETVKPGRRATGQPPAEIQERRQYLTFLLGREVFAIGILVIKEIIEFGDLTPVPMMPAFVRGVINLRGSVVPVIDLAARFGRQPVQRTRRTCIVIVEVEDEGERQDAGLLAAGQAPSAPGSAFLRTLSGSAERWNRPGGAAARDRSADDERNIFLS